MIEYCPNCGAETREGARFCYQCGTALQPDVPPVALATATPAMTMAPAPVATTPVAIPGVPYPSLPPGMPPFPVPPYPFAPGQPLPQRSGMATAGFCLGLATVILGIALTWLGTIMGICGLIFSLIGLRETGSQSRLPGGPRTGRGLAIWGIVLSAIGIVGSVALLIFILQNAARFGIQLPRSLAP